MISQTEVDHIVANVLAVIVGRLNRNLVDRFDYDGRAFDFNPQYGEYVTVQHIAYALGLDYNHDSGKFSLKEKS